METPGLKGLTAAKLIKGMTHTKISIYLFPCTDCRKKEERSLLSFFPFISAVLLVNKTISTSFLCRHLFCLLFASTFYHSALNPGALGLFWFKCWLLNGLWSDCESAICGGHEGKGPPGRTDIGTYLWGNYWVLFTAHTLSSVGVIFHQSFILPQ